MLATIKNKCKEWILSGNHNAVGKQACLKCIKPGDSILDIGPGQGEILNAIYSQFGNSVKLSAIDRHQFVLENCPTNTELIKMDLGILGDYQDGINQMPVPDHSFDVIILTEVIEHITFPQLFLAEISRIINPDGYFIVSTPNIHCLGNRLAVLFGMDKVFPRVGQEGFLTKLDFDAYGHVAHYSKASLKQMIGPWFEIEFFTGAGFKVPALRYMQPVLASLLPTLANNLVMICRKKGGLATGIKCVICPLKKSNQLILPDNRCLHPQAHSKTCNSCEHFHKDFLHKRNRKKRRGYVPEGN